MNIYIYICIDIHTYIYIHTDIHILFFCVGRGTQVLNARQPEISTFTMMVPRDQCY